ncbi:MAG: maleylpyruvate isomerase N-terminal domain-containing protein [Mycolicibacterium neoaurum]|uniref:maleylpyruvate isomerase N-terminal domain-containing protein n=1 Tax=Mycolicibacterium neoaurum TaxID=1795 RepID=UPI002FFBD660
MTDSSVAETYADLADGMATVIASVAPQQWDAASACAGWSARDVLTHLIDTQREFFERHGFALPPRPDPADPVTAWSTHTAAIREILADPQVPARAFDGHFGPTTIGENPAAFLRIRPDRTPLGYRRGDRVAVPIHRRRTGSIGGRYRGIR